MAHAPGSTLKALVRLGKEPGDCWEWLGNKNEDGYPAKTFHGKAMSGRRWLWEQLFGPLPREFEVMVACGNRGCANPHHFTTGTRVDAQRAGAGCTLLPADVNEIRLAKKDRGPAVAAALAERLGVSVGTVYDVWGKRSWCKNPKRYPKGGQSNVSQGAKAARGPQFGQPVDGLRAVHGSEAGRGRQPAAAAGGAAAHPPGGNGEAVHEAHRARAAARAGAPGSAPPGEGLGLAAAPVGA